MSSETTILLVVLFPMLPAFLPPSIAALLPNACLLFSDREISLHV
jgi:hypothetical protein